MTRPLTLEEVNKWLTDLAARGYSDANYEFRALETARMLYAVKEAAEKAIEAGVNLEIHSDDSLDEALRPFTERGETMEEK